MSSLQPDLAKNLEKTIARSLQTEPLPEEEGEETGWLNGSWQVGTGVDVLGIGAETTLIKSLLEGIGISQIPTSNHLRTLRDLLLGGSKKRKRTLKSRP